MGVIEGIAKATLQVRSSFNNTTTSKTVDVLAEGLNLNTANNTGDKVLLSNLVKAIYAKSRRAIVSASVIGTSENVVIYE